MDKVVIKTRLPHDKLEQMYNTVITWLKKKKATKRETLSLVDLLQHATKVVQCGRPFLSRMYATAAKVKQLEYYTHINRDFRSDLYWWNTFLISWNGLSLLRNIPIAPQCHIYIDVSGSWGCGAVFLDQWFQLSWKESWFNANVMAIELVPIILSTAIWGPQLHRSQVCYHCYNSSAVAALSKSSAHDAVVMQLLRCLWFFIAHYDIHIDILQILRCCCKSPISQ